MSNDWLSSISSHIKRRSLNQDDIDHFLQNLTQPALVISKDTGNILLANNEAEKFLNSPIEHLLKKSINDFIISYSDQNGNKNDSPQYFISKLSTSNGKRRDQLSNLGFLPLGKHNILVVFGDQAGFSRDGHDFSSKNFLRNLNNIIEKQFSATLFSIFPEILQWLRQVALADFAALYLAGENEPTFSIQAVDGDNPGFPEKLSAQDLPFFQFPIVWQLASSPSFPPPLTKLLHDKKISFLASVPVGESGAIIGVLLVGSELMPAPYYLEDLCSLAASFINKQIEIQLRSSELEDRNANLLEKIQTYEIIDEFITEGILVISPDLKILSLNTAITETLGYTTGDTLGQPVENVIIGTEELNPYLESVKSTCMYQKAVNQWLFRRNGEQFISNIHFFPVIYNNEIKSIVILIEDLSDQERIRMQTEQLEQRAYMGEVTAIFAHEVLNPVNNISTGLQLFSRNLPANDMNQKEIARLLQDSDRLVDMMRSVLTISKPNEYSMVSVDISKVLTRLIERRLSRMHNAKINIDIKVHPETPFVNVDLPAIEQAFTNILNNAIQAMGVAGGDIVIKIQPSEENYESLDHDEYKKVEISIADTGPGIPEEIQERIFQPFFTTKPTGSGLGLTIVKRIITMHKGTIRLESFPGGTVFYITLPTYNLDSKLLNKLESTL